MNDIKFDYNYFVYMIIKEGLINYSKLTILRPKSFYSVLQSRNKKLSKIKHE